MAILLERAMNGDGTPDLGSGIFIEVPTRHVEEFKELIFRATNLWPDSSAAIKIFADMVIHGKVLQNYEEMSTYKPMTGKARSKS